jgi:hypothetical protein
MQKYYIDVAEGPNFVEDHVGTVLPDAEAGRQIALQALADIIQDELPAGRNQTFIATVRDEEGTEFYCAKVTLSSRVRPVS